MNIQSKIFLFSLFLFISNTAFSQGKAKTTQIKGKLVDNSIYTEISLRLPVKEATVVSSAKIEGDGGFDISFLQTEANIFRLQLADNNNMILILQPGDKVNLTLNAKNVGEFPQISGSDETVLYLKTGQQLSAFNQVYDSINTAWKETLKADNGDSLQALLKMRYNQLAKAEKNMVQQFIRNNTQSLAGLLFIDKLDIAQDFETFDLYDRDIIAKYPENIFLKDLHARVEAERRLTIGSIAPEIKLPNPEGVEIALSSLRGKVVLVDFWAAWCRPCRQENPHVLAIYNKYHDKGFEVFGVSLDRDKEAWMKAIKDDALVWNQVSDLQYWKSEAARLYNVNAIPSSFLLDKEGKIIGKKLRGEELSRKMEEIFGF